MDADKVTVERDRPVTPTEIAKLRESVGWEPGESSLEQMLRGSYSHFTIRHKQQLVAFLNVVSDGIGDALLVNIIVHPQHQKQGLGTKFVSTAIASLTADGIQCIWTTFIPKNEPFYLNCGFKILRSGVVDNSTQRAGC